MELQHGFGAGVDVEFAINVLKMPADGARTQPQAIGYLFVGQPQRSSSMIFFSLGRSSSISAAVVIGCWKAAMTLRAISRGMGTPPNRASRTAATSSSGVQRLSR